MIYMRGHWVGMYITPDIRYYGYTGMIIVQSACDNEKVEEEGETIP